MILSTIPSPQHCQEQLPSTKPGVSPKPILIDPIQVHLRLFCWSGWAPFEPPSLQEVGLIAAEWRRSWGKGRVGVGGAGHLEGFCPGFLSGLPSLTTKLGTFMFWIQVLSLPCVLQTCPSGRRLFSHFTPSFYIMWGLDKTGQIKALLKLLARGPGRELCGQGHLSDRNKTSSSIPSTAHRDPVL